MENRIEYIENGKGDFDEFDLLYPCNQVEPKYQKTCYDNLGSYILHKRNYSTEITFRDCETISNVEYINLCYMDAALYATVEYFDNLDKAVEMCEKANPKFQESCIDGALFAIIIYVDAELSDDFCGLLSENFYEFCTNKIEIRLKQI